MTDPDLDDDRFSGVFLGPDEGDDSSSPGGTAGSGDEDSQGEAVPYVGAGSPEEEGGAGDTGDGT